MAAKDYKKRELITVSFPSISSLRSECMNPDKLNHPTNKRNFTRSIVRASYGPSWFGMDGDYTAVMRAIEQGDEHLTRLLMANEITKKLPRAIGIGRQLFRSDMGDELDIHAVNRGGADRAWSSKKRVIKKARSNIKIIVDIGGNCNIEAGILAARGLAGAGLAMALEKAGYSVGVYGAFALRDGFEQTDKNLLISVQIKPAVGRISAGILASTVCLSGFFRTYGFGAIISTIDQHDGVATDSLGYVMAVEPYLPAEPNIMAFVVPSSVHDSATAQAWIAQTIRLLEAST